jgi:hypothetical protein
MKSYPFRTLALFLGVGLALATASDARAKVDGVDVAVTAFVIAGNLAGVPVPPEQADFVKSLVRCAVNNKSVPECAREAVIGAALSRLPGDAQKYAGTFISCTMGGGKVADCASAQVISQMPDQVQPLAKCLVAGKNVADCAGQFALGQALDRVPEEVRPLAKCVIENGPGGAAACAKQTALAQVPAQARPLADCLANGGDVAACAAQFGIQQGAAALDEATRKATDEALKALKELKADGIDAVATNIPNSVNNIIKVVQGFENNDVGAIGFYGGKEVVKAICNIILDIFVTPALTPVFSPIVDTMVERRAKLVEDLLKAAKSGDSADRIAVKIAQIIFEFYELTFAEAPCALLPDGGFKDATCGNFAKAVVAVSNLAAGVVTEVLDFTKGILKELGVYQIIDAVVSKGVEIAKDAWNEVKSWFDGDDDKVVVVYVRPPPVCAPPQDYYLNSYVSCVGRSVDGGMSTAAVTAACVKAFSPCFNNAKEVCQSMETPYNALVGRISAGVSGGADAFMSGAAATAFMQSQNNRCTRGFWERHGEDLVSQCANSVGKAMPRVSSAACPARGDGRPQLSTRAWDACAAALNKVDLAAVTKAVCPAGVAAPGTPGGGCKPPEVKIKPVLIGGPPFRPHFMQTGTVSYSETGFKYDPATGLITPRADDCNDGRLINFGGGRRPADEVDWLKLPPTKFNPGPYIKPGSRLPFLDLPLRPLPDHRISSVLFRPGQGGSRADDRLKLPQVAKLDIPELKLPRSGGSSGYNMIDPRTGNAPVTTRLKLPGAGRPSDSVPKLRPPKNQPTVLARPPASGGSSGSGTVRNSAIERLSGDGMGGGFRGVGSSGSSGAIVSPGRKPPSSNSVVNTSRSGGSSGINMVQPSRPGGSSGFNTSRSGGSSGTNTARPGPDRNIDYGGCSGCGKQTPSGATIHPR